MAYRLIFVNFIEQIRPKGPSPSKIMRAHFLIGELSWGLAIVVGIYPSSYRVYLCKRVMLGVDEHNELIIFSTFLLNILHV